MIKGIGLVLPNTGCNINLINQSHFRPRDVYRYICEHPGTSMESLQTAMGFSRNCKTNYPVRAAIYDVVEAMIFSRIVVKRERHYYPGPKQPKLMEQEVIT